MNRLGNKVCNNRKVTELVMKFMNSVNCGTHKDLLIEHVKKRIVPDQETNSSLKTFDEYYTCRCKHIHRHMGKTENRRNHHEKVKNR